MKEFSPEIIQSSETNEITKKEVLDSLIKDPSDYDVFIKWKDARNERAIRENAPWSNLGLEVESARILTKAAKISGDKKLFGYALDVISIAILFADRAGDSVLMDRLFEIYKEPLAEYVKIMIDSGDKGLFENAMDTICDIADQIKNEGSPNCKKLHKASDDAYKTILAEYRKRFPKEE